MEAIKQFLKRKDIEISLKRYGIDALGAMAQGLFCSLLIGTIINTLGTQFHIDALTRTVATVSGTEYTVGGLASAMSGPAMGGGHRLRPEMPASGALFSDYRRLLCQCPGRCRRPSGRAVCGHSGC